MMAVRTGKNVIIASVTLLLDEEEQEQMKKHPARSIWTRSWPRHACYRKM